MRLKSALALAGVAVLGVTAVAAAERAPVHVMLIHLPDGQVEQLRYTGDVAPRVVVQPAADPMLAAFGAGSPFAMMERSSADMDRQMAAMMQQASAMAQATPEQLRQASASGQPGTVTSFTYVSTTGGNGCSQSVRTVSLGDGKAPQVTRTSSGDCSAMQAHAPTPAALPAKPATPKVDPASI